MSELEQHKALIKEITDRANDKYYDTKLIANAVYWILEQMADRKTENSSEKPNNCDTCIHNKLEWYSEVCDGCSKAHSNYEPKDEPQADCPWK